MVSTSHGPDFQDGEVHEGNNIMKPTVILDNNKAKGGIDLSNEMISYYSPTQKSVKWYRKVLFQCISIAVLNNFVLYNKFYVLQKPIQLASFIKSIGSSLFQSPKNFN